MENEFSTSQYIGKESVAALSAHDDLRRRVHESTANGFERADFDPSDTDYHLLSGDFVVIREHPTRRDIGGFLSAQFRQAGELFPGIELPIPGETPVAYLFGTAVAKDYQGNGLMGEMLDRFLEQVAERQEFSVIMTRTQNPHVEAGLRSALQRNEQRVEVVRTKVPGAYGRLLTGVLPPPIRDSSIQQVYENELDRQAGDAFILTFVLQK